MIPRLLKKVVVKRLTELQKVLIILGARQVGKTTLLKEIEKEIKTDGYKTLYFNCDDLDARRFIDTTSLSKIKDLIANIDFLLVDEAQRLENPGLTFKLIHDEIPSVKILATGSSSFEIKNKLSDSLTGRYLDFILYPLSFEEVFLWQTREVQPPFYSSYAEVILEQALIYGLYPEIYLEKNPSNKELFLQKIIESYLFKDILMMQLIRRSEAIVNLARALAYQIGSEINANELANRLKIDRKTVMSYLDILEQSFVIVRLYPYSQNPRREIGRNYKVYFVDLGVRNALIGDFNPFSVRGDRGALWENFLVIERFKKFANRGEIINSYFWRSYSGAEVDYLEFTKKKQIEAFEIKMDKGKLGRSAKTFHKYYPKTKVKLITKDNYLEFVTDGTQKV